MYIIGIILVAISLIILAIALLRSKKETPAQDILLDEDTTIQRVFEIIDNLPNSEKFNPILLKQEPVENRLSEVFDELFSGGQITWSEKVAQTLVDFAPDIASAHTRLGLAQLRLGKTELAEQSFRNSLELNPKDKRSANNLEYLLNRQKKYDESVKILENTLDEQENNIVTLVNLGIALFHSGDTERSYEILNAAYKLNPDIPDIHLYIGHCLNKFDEKEKAKLAYERYHILKEKQSGKMALENAEKEANWEQIESSELVEEMESEQNDIQDDLPDEAEHRKVALESETTEPSDDEEIVVPEQKEDENSQEKD